MSNEPKKLEGEDDSKCLNWENMYLRREGE